MKKTSKKMIVINIVHKERGIDMIFYYVKITLYLKVSNSTLCENDCGYEYVKISTEKNNQNESYQSVIDEQLLDIAFMYSVSKDDIKTVTKQEYEANQRKGKKAS